MIIIYLLGTGIVLALLVLVLLGGNVLRLISARVVLLLILVAACAWGLSSWKARPIVPNLQSNSRRDESYQQAPPHQNGTGSDSDQSTVSTASNSEHTTPTEPHKVEPDMRIVVADFQGTTPGQPFASQADAVRRSFEQRLTTFRDLVLLEESKREEIIKILKQYQDEQALYKSDTLPKLGRQFGATHIVFGRIERQVDTIVSSCRLVRLESRVVQKEQDVHIRADNQVDPAISYLADKLIAQLTEVSISEPSKGSHCDRQIVVRGTTRFLPKDWVLFVSVLPLKSGASKQYPQTEMTISDEGDWESPTVYLGNESPEHNNKEYSIYVLLVDPQHAEELRQYLSQGNSEGISLISWNKRQYRVFGPVKVTRQDKQP